MKRIIASLITAFALFLVPAYASNPLTSGAQTVTITANVNESITLALTGGPIVLPMTGALSNAITASVTFNVIKANHTQGIWSAAWFSSTTALSGAGSIPSSSLSLTTTLNLATSTNVCNGAANTQTGSVAGATCEATNEAPQSVFTTNPSGTITDSYQLAYTNPSVIPTPGAYNGTLNIVYVVP